MCPAKIRKMDKQHDMQPKPLQHPQSPVTGQTIASVHDTCKNGCGLEGQAGDWTKLAGGLRYHTLKLKLDQIPCDPDYPPGPDENWNRQ